MYTNYTNDVQRVMYTSNTVLEETKPGTKTKYIIITLSDLCLKPLQSIRVVMVQGCNARKVISEVYTSFVLQCTVSGR